MSDFEYADLISPKALQFYRDHAQDSIPKLLLKFGHDPQKKAWVAQLDSRLRAKRKLPTWSENEQIVFPPKRNLEQASSEITALYKASLFSYQKSADLTCGTGVDSWAFAQQSEAHQCIEPSRELTSIITHNFNTLGINNISIQATTTEQFLAKSKDHVDLVFIDPSRRAESGKKVIRLEDYSPNVIALQERLLQFASTVLIKVSPMVDLQYLKAIFKNHLAAIHIVAVQNEVKEILVVLHNEVSRFSMHTVDIRQKQTIKAEFTNQVDSNSFIQATEVEHFLYEPNAAVLKSGYFNALCALYDVKKLDRHSHLYTANHRIDAFPGFTYTIKEVGSPFKLKTSVSKASIISRNFPQKPELIKKRLKLKDGNDHRIFATTVHGKKVFILGEPFRNK